MLIYNNISDDSRDFRYSILKMATQHWCFCFQSCTRTGLKSHSHSRLSWHGVTIQWLRCKAVLMADRTNLFSRCQRKQNLSQGISTCSKSTAKPVRAGWKNDSRFMWRQWEEAYRTLSNMNFPIFLCNWDSLHARLNSHYKAGITRKRSTIQKD